MCLKTRVPLPLSLCAQKLTKVATSYKKLANMLQKLLIYALLHESWTYAKFEKSINFVDSSTTHWILEVVGTKLITDYPSSEKSPQNQWYQQNIVNILRKILKFRQKIWQWMHVSMEMAVFQKISDFFLEKSFFIYLCF